MPQSHMWAAAPVLDSTDTACIPLQHRVIGAEMGVLRSGVAKPSLASRRRDVPGKSKSCEEGMGQRRRGICQGLVSGRRLEREKLFSVAGCRPCLC